MPPSAMRICLFATFDPRNWSGGRYHALMLAAAAARCGFEMHVVANHRPAFWDELGALCHNSWHFHGTEDFRQSLPDGEFEFVILVPTGIFLPEFYEAALEFAGHARARLILLNFESANWFNQLAPQARDPRLWDYWQRACLRGGLVLSSTRVSHEMARHFYASDRGALRFEVWHPPINSLACHLAGDTPSVGSIVACVRPSDRHKGAADLLALDPHLFDHRRLDIIGGTEIPEAFHAALRERIGLAQGADLVIHTRISDIEKFRLLHAAQVLLFPSHFEGYGYPPIEAAFAGAEVACYGLEVLQETVGKLAHMAIPGDTRSLETALDAALDVAPRRAALRAAVAPFADFEQAVPLLGDILLRTREALPGLRPPGFRAVWGPWAGTKPKAPSSTTIEGRAGYLPPVIEAIRTRGDRWLLTIVVSSRGALTGAETTEGDVFIGLPRAGFISDPGTWHRQRIHLVVPATLAGETLRLALQGGAEAKATEHVLRIDSVLPQDKTIRTRAGISGIRRTGDGVIIDGWVLSNAGALEVWVVLGVAEVRRIPLTTPRPDLARLYPGYRNYRCGYQLDLPADADPESGLRLHIVADDILEDVLEGWPPHAIRPAPESLDDARQKQVDRRGRKSSDRPFNVAVLDVTNETWRCGVGRVGTPARPGAILIARTVRAETIRIGDTILLASGRLRQVTGLTRYSKTVAVDLDLPVSAALDGGGRAAVVLPPLAPAPPPEALVIQPLSDAYWRNGVWNLPDRRYKQGILLKGSERAKPPLTAGAVIRLAHTGVCRVTEVDAAAEGIRIWLDRTVLPFGDGAPQSVEWVAHESASNLERLSLADRNRDGAEHPSGGDRGLPDRIVDFRVSPAALGLKRGDVLEFPGGGRRQVLDIRARDDVVCTLLDMAAPPFCRESGPIQILARGPTLPSPTFSVPPFPAKDPIHLKLADLARRDGRAIPAAEPFLANDRPRILLVTPVPPLPADQGNRVVTRNMVDHLVELGFDVDIVLQGAADLSGSPLLWGDRVRVLQSGFPSWAEVDSVRLRREIAKRVKSQRLTEADRFFVETVEEAASQFHPQFIIRDETVELAKTLYRKNRYQYIVCNYTHMLRIPLELARISPLPPVTVLTHDVLSRLRSGVGRTKLDTMYRACTPAIERAVLDQLPGTVIVAISEAERAAFQGMGVTNPIVVCEYDGYEEFRRHQVPETSFDRRTLVYQGSANDMNLAGLGWFFDHCWDRILEQHPSARLVVCGLISDRLPKNIPNVILRGAVPRLRLLEQMQDSTIAINPCLAGTGLKIKTVEACCIGLPSVCTPVAVDGLEDVAADFAVVAPDAVDFADACISLLEDREAWTRLRSGALETASHRFERDRVYCEWDETMGWAVKAEARRLGGRPAGAADDGDTLDPETSAANPSEDRPSLERRAITAPEDLSAVRDAALAALGVRDGWSAAVHGGTMCARWPDRTIGYRLVAAALEQLGQLRGAAEALAQALAVDPDNPGLRQEFLDLAARDGWSVAGFESHPISILPCALGVPVKLDSGRLEGRRLGWGWSFPESWGTWTEGPAARLRLKPEVGSVEARYLVVNAHAYTDPASAARVAIAVDGQRVGCWTWLSGSNPRPFTAALPSEPRHGTDIVIDFLVGTPRMPRREGRVVDPRRLGLAVRWVMLDTVAPANAFYGKMTE